jgi:hypothetical protein
MEQSFNLLPWHDSKLLDLCITRSTAGDRAWLRVALRGPQSTLRMVQVEFLEVAIVEASIDVDAKRVCADDISGASCTARSNWIEGLAKDRPYDSFDGYLEFDIALIPPGGSVRILAKGYAIREAPETLGS